MTLDCRRPSAFPIYINGRFLARPITGVERFAGGLLRSLDAILSTEQAGRWTVLVPPGVSTDQGLTQIKVRQIGRGGGHVWEQASLTIGAWDGILINLCNSGPIIHPRELVVIHDALVYRFPQGFSWHYRLLHQTLGRMLSRRARIVTVSEFSRAELAAILHVPAATIGVLYNAVDHLETVIADETVIERLDLRSCPFFLFVGSPAPNKNLATALEGFCAAGVPDVRFVIVGAASRVFAATPNVRLSKNCLFTGRLTDGEIKALYNTATALVFPSIYEGFGIPPLEAMSLGCPVIASDIPVVREVCGTNIRYFDPRDPFSIAKAMREEIGPRGQRADPTRLEAAQTHSRRYSWKDSARGLLTLSETFPC